MSKNDIKKKNLNQNLFFFKHFNWKIRDPSIKMYSIM